VSRIVAVPTFAFAAPAATTVTPATSAPATSFTLRLGTRFRPWTLRSVRTFRAIGTLRSLHAFRTLGTVCAFRTLGTFWTFRALGTRASLVTLASSTRLRHRITNSCFCCCRPALARLGTIAITALLRLSAALVAITPGVVATAARPPCPARFVALRAPIASVALR
jgi:hypothetical protein